ncbi:RHS repeat-associated protein [Catenulispora sp. GP43]|uniref:RHS repeat-associated core domain-containing protein n=1 Tax=Catenulispora sp. GP43 TaxID=3156263 RepID=UPI003515B37B
MARPTGWDILGLDGDPTPGVVESVQALAKEFGDFAHDVESAYRSLNSFGSDTAAMQWIGQTAEAFKGKYGPLPGRLQKLYTSYSEASDALSAYAPLLQAAQTKADTALRQAQDANSDLQRATTNATNAASDLKTVQKNQAASPDPKAVTDAQTAHDTAQTNLNNAKAKMAALAKQADDAYNDRIAAAKACASALHHAQSDGIHNKSWWDHVGEDLSTWGGEIGKIAGELAPVLDILALATSWIPGVDVVTAALAEADNLIALAGTAMATLGDAMQGHWGDALLGAGMLALTFVGGRFLGSAAEDAEGEAGALEGGADALGPEMDGTDAFEDDAENSVGEDARTAEGKEPASCERDPVDVVSGWMLTGATDVALPGVLPLVLRRAYASGYTTGRLFGPGWSSTLDQRLSVNDSGIHFAGDDAQRLDYPIPADGEQALPARGARWPLAWDRDTDEIRITDPSTGHTRHFDTVHYTAEVGQIRDLTAITDRNGNRIRILRDEHGTPTTVEHPGYRVDIDTIATPAGPRISALRGAAAKEFHYDHRGRLTEVVNSSGLPFTYAWDDTDRITAWQDRSGFRYEYVYDRLGRVVRGEGELLAGSFAYDPANRTTAVTDSLGDVRTYCYDENGHITSETDPLGNTTTVAYDAYGRILSRTDALGGTTTFERDAAGDARRITMPDGAVTVLEYDGFHRVVHAVGMDGADWRRGYDDAGNLVSATDPSGATTTIEYDARGALAAVVDPLGAATRYTTDDAGLPIQVTDPVGCVVTATRDASGRVTRMADGSGAVTVLDWSTEGRLLSRTGPDGATTRWEHDADGRLLKVTNPIGATTVFEPGPLDTLVARTGPDGVRHTFAYDSEQRLLRVINPAGAGWDYAYDPAGRLTGETDFTGRRLGYEYDAAGRLTARTTGTGQRIGFRRDASGRVLTRTSAEGEYEYCYDEAGRLASATGMGTSLAFERDVLGRVVAETVDGRSSSYRYDPAGRRVGRTTASGAESVWRFDAAGRPAELTAGAHHLAFAFDAAGREDRRLLGPETWLTRGYDQAGRLTAQRLGTGDSSVFDRSWAWRPDGVPEEIQDSLRGTRRIASDLAGRPTGVTGRDWNETYAYDAFGNLSTADADPEHAERAERAQQAPATRTLIRRAGRTHHEYDSAGRVVRTTRRTLDGRRRTWRYTWDSEDRLVQADTPDDGTWRYAYDPAGRRIGKHRVADGEDAGEHTVFVWDGPRLAEEHTSRPDGSVVILTWDYDPGTYRPAAQRRRTTAVAAADQEDVDEAFHAIVTDLVGTPTELVTPDGRVAWHTTTTVWGRTTATATEDDLDCPLRFPGQYHDPETGLHYNLHRYYSPETGAYLTPDPLGLAPAPNDHAYVPNPLTWTDPLGLQCGEGDGSAPDLYHGTDLDSAQSIVDNGLDQQAARLKGGGDVFWTTTNKSDAEIFATVNPSLSESTGVVGIRLQGGIEAGIRSGILQEVPELPGAYTVSDWEGLNSMATFELVSSSEG